MEKKDIKLVPAADKTVKIVEYMANQDSRGCGVTQIADVLGYNKGTVYSILHTLVANHWVEQDAITGKYFLTNTIALLGGKVEKENRLVRDFQMVGAQIERTCGELVNLHFPKGLSLVKLVAKVSSTAHSLRVDLPLGSDIPVISSSGGKCLICEYDDATLLRIFHQCSNNYTSSTIHTEQDFLDEIYTVRSEGYGTNYGEYENGVFSVAAPIRNNHNKIIAAINIVIPEVRYSKELEKELIRLVKEGAMKLSYLHGYTDANQMDFDCNIHG